MEWAQVKGDHRTGRVADGCTLMLGRSPFETAVAPVPCRAWFGRGMISFFRKKNGPYNLCIPTCGNQFLLDLYQPKYHTNEAGHLRSSCSGFACEHVRGTLRKKGHRVLCPQPTGNGRNLLQIQKQVSGVIRRYEVTEGENSEKNQMGRPFGIVSVCKTV